MWLAAKMRNFGMGGAENWGCGLAKGKYNWDSTFGKVACFVSY